MVSTLIFPISQVHAPPSAFSCKSLYSLWWSTHQLLLLGNCRDFHSSGSLWWHCGSGGNGTKRAQESALRYKCTSAPTETNIGAKTTDIKKKRTTWKATAAITLKENCFNLSKIILAEIKSHIEADVLARLTQSIDLKDLEGSSSLREEATEEPAKYCENILEKEGKLVEGAELEEEEEEEEEFRSSGWGLLRRYRGETTVNRRHEKR
ncbi:hypothetical protein PV326_011082, partial [Microctonus aethiopoides]